MRRAAVRVVAGAALWCAASCLNIKDVVQPGEVETGEKFEVEVLLNSFTGDAETAEHCFAGVVAVSIPNGAEVLKATYEGAAKGRCDKYTALVPNDLPERPGYCWVFLVTAETYLAKEYGGKAYVATLTMRAPQTPGEYRLAYASGAVDVDAADTYDRGVYWESVPGDRRADLERGMTVK